MSIYPADEPVDVWHEHTPDGWVIRARWPDGSITTSVKTWGVERKVIIALRNPRKLKWEVNNA